MVKLMAFLFGFSQSVWMYLSICLSVSSAVSIYNLSNGTNGSVNTQSIKALSITNHVIYNISHDTNLTAKLMIDVKVQGVL